MVSNHNEASLGPLRGLKVVEFAGLGPGPFACMLLSDMGADVVTVDRPGAKLGDPSRIVNRGRTVVLADLKDPASRQQIIELLDAADILVEGFRPGVMERLGLGPTELHGRNPRLIYGRITGWGQQGPLSSTAGHDIDYIALTGALHAIGTEDGGPTPPLNLVGDYGGGSLYLISGILAALYERSQSGLGQVIDAAITDGVNSMMTHFHGIAHRDQFMTSRSANTLDGGAPYYSVYKTLDNQYVAVGAIEPIFFAELCRLIDLDLSWCDAQYDTSRWPDLRQIMASKFAQKSRNDWQKLLENTDACTVPVLSLYEAADHHHLVARASFEIVDGVRQPVPAPRFSRSTTGITQGVPKTITLIENVLRRWT
jgi:alpha-methylacyl-CoA racemase